jgi:heparan sulfate N-deacetylase/N-sulfotransferase NDST2
MFNLQALLTSQKQMQAMIPGFRFNLGFSGKYFHHGNDEENAGEDLLMGKKQN